MIQMTDIETSLIVFEALKPKHGFKGYCVDIGGVSLAISKREYNRFDKIAEVGKQYDGVNVHLRFEGDKYFVKCEWNYQIEIVSTTNAFTHEYRGWKHNFEISEDEYKTFFRHQRAY